MKVWVLSKDSRQAEVTDTGWINGQDVDFLEQLKALFEEPLQKDGSFPLPGMRGYPEKRVEQLQQQGFKVIETYEV